MLYVAVANQDQPTSISDWRVEPVANVDIEEPLDICELNGEAAFSYKAGASLYFGYYEGASFSTHVFATGGAGPIENVSITAIGGKPAAVFHCQSGSPFGQGMAYAYAQTATPTSGSDWTIAAIQGIPEPNSVNGAIQFENIGGRPMFQADGPAAGSLLLCYGLSASPGGSQWGSYTFVGSNVGSGGIYSMLYDKGGLPALLYNFKVGTERWIRYSVASSLEPLLDGDWTTHNTLPSDSPKMVFAGSAGSKPAYCRYELGDTRLYLSALVNPTQESDWTGYDMPSSIESLQLIVDHGGQPAFFATDWNGTSPQEDDQLVYRYLTP
jgi:hypothetical protein